MNASSIVFREKSFCFTGKLADLPRSLAQQATRARGGLTTNAVGADLAYLVVGSIPSPAWKFGSYGTKIDRARQLLSERGRPLLVPEGTFMDALAFTPEVNDGAIDAKVVVCTVEFVVPNRSAFDQRGLATALEAMRSEFRCHVTARSFPVFARRELFDPEDYAGIPDNWLIVHYRIVSQRPLDEPVQLLASAVDAAFECLGDVKCRHSWFERREGTTGYIRLLREVPEGLRVPGL